MEQLFREMAQKWRATIKESGSLLDEYLKQLDEVDCPEGAWPLLADQFDALAREFVEAVEEFRAAAKLPKPIGRPKTLLQPSTIREELKTKISVAALARKLEVSRQTIYRRLKEGKKQGGDPHEEDSSGVKTPQ